MSFTILSRQHSLIRGIRHLRHSRKQRALTNQLVVRGAQTIQNLIAQEVPLVRSLKTRESTFLWPDGVATDCISRDLMAYLWYDDRDPSGVRGVYDPTAEVPQEVAVFQRPSTIFEAPKYSRVLGLDGVEYPENVGLLLKAAMDLGFEAAVFLNQTCDPWNPKVLEETAGRHANFPLCQITLEDLGREILAQNWQPVVGHLSGLPIGDLPPKKGVLLMVGSEARGASRGVLDSFTKVAVPQSEKVDSLNVAVAGAIMMDQLMNLPV